MRELDLVWLSDPGAKHSRNIRANEFAAVAVYDSMQIWGQSDRGIQIFGPAREVEGSAADGFEALYAARFPDFSRLDQHGVSRLRSAPTSAQAFRREGTRNRRLREGERQTRRPGGVGADGHLPFGDVGTTFYAARDQGTSIRASHVCRQPPRATSPSSRLTLVAGPNHRFPLNALPTSRALDRQRGVRFDPALL